MTSPLDPTECLVCGGRSLEPRQYTSGSSVTLGGPGKTNIGEVSYYHCTNCEADFAVRDKVLRDGDKVYVLHLSITGSYDPPFDHLVSGPYWDANTHKRAHSDAPIAPPDDYKEMGENELGAWTQAQLARKGDQE